MPLLSSSSPVEAAVDKATNEYNAAEDWQQIMDLCDAIKTGVYSPKDALKCIMKRVQHRVPHVSIQALSLLGACVNNCGKPFHLEICSRDWSSEAKHIVYKAHPKVSEKLKELIKQWASDFKDDPQLSLMGKLYSRLQSDGVEFPSKDNVSGSTPGATSSKQKDELGFKEDIDLAIALSLQESDVPPKTASSSLYPSMGTATASSPPLLQSQSVAKRVKALYDFEAAEDNELSFKTGELIAVLDDSDENWWKGENHRGIGLFPANFVTSDLSEPKPVAEKKRVHFVDQVTAEPSADTRPKPEISQEKLELCISMLKNASPTEEDDEEETIQGLELACRDMKPLLQAKIEETQSQKVHLEEIQEKFAQALAMYQTLMKEPIPTPIVVPPPYSSVQAPYQQYAGQGGVTYGQQAAGYAQVASDPSYGHRPPAYDQTGMVAMAHGLAAAAAASPQPNLQYPAYPVQGAAATPLPQHPSAVQPDQYGRQQPAASYYPQPQDVAESYGAPGQQYYGYPGGNATPQHMYPQAPVYQ